MKTPIVVALALALAALAGATDVTLKDGRVLRNACWGEGSDEYSVVVRYDGGVARFRLEEFTPEYEKILREECRERFGTKPPPTVVDVSVERRTHERVGDFTVEHSFKMDDAPGGRVLIFTSTISELGVVKTNHELRFWPKDIPQYRDLAGKFLEWHKKCLELKLDTFRKHLGEWEVARADFEFRSDAYSSTSRAYIHVVPIAVDLVWFTDDAKLFLEMVSIESVKTMDDEFTAKARAAQMLADTLK